MPVVERIASPEREARAARRAQIASPEREARAALRAQIARLERELALIMATTYPAIAPGTGYTAGGGDTARGRHKVRGGDAARGGHKVRSGDAARGGHKVRSGDAARIAAVARARPRLQDLAALERTRDALAARLAAALRACEDQERRQAAARVRLADMKAHPERHPRARIANADLGLPGCTTYRVVRRLTSPWWCVKVSSGCPLPSAAT